MKTQDFLFELGCEELPASALQGIAEALGKSIQSSIQNLGLVVPQPQLYYTPRRIAVFIHDLPSEVPASTIERKGPVKTAGFDQQGQPTQALNGFLRSCGASLTDVYEVSSDKGTWLAVRITKPAIEMPQVLPEIVTEAVHALSLKKTMRWGDQPFSFLRPVRWILALLGEAVLPIKLFGLEAVRHTFGHRFHHPGAIVLERPSEYLSALRSAYVMADANERRDYIVQHSKQALEELALSDLNLHFGRLEEVIHLVEWPQPLLCRFKKEFLSLPSAILITTMETHQRVFPVFQEGRLAPFFIAVANIKSKHPESVIQGNEKVVHARLSDAQFFYQEDLKIKLEDHLSGLKKITFQQGLGSLFDKTKRLEMLAQKGASCVGLNPEIMGRAALLCKTDLLSNMVQEFPELQGYMGEQYARAQGEPDSIAIAIREHYLPNRRGADLPRTGAGALLAVFDKLDTLVGLFAKGQKPSSSSDPYALRRQAMGIVSILRDTTAYAWTGTLDLPWAIRTFLGCYQTQNPELLADQSPKKNMNLEEVSPSKESAALKESLNLLQEPLEKSQPLSLASQKVCEEVAAFIFERAKYAYFEDYPSINSRFIEAIESSEKQRGQGFQPAVFHKRILGLMHFSEQHPDALKKLGELFKRIQTILAQSPQLSSSDLLISVDLGVNKQEQDLLRQIQAIYGQIELKCMSDDYANALEEARHLIAFIDQFFEAFLIMDENERVRHNRLNLLKATHYVLSRIADFSQL